MPLHCGSLPLGSGYSPATPSSIRAAGRTFHGCPRSFLPVGMVQLHHDSPYLRLHLHHRRKPLFYLQSRSLRSGCAGPGAHDPGRPFRQPAVLTPATSSSVPRDRCPLDLHRLGGQLGLFQIDPLEIHGPLHNVGAPSVSGLQTQSQMWKDDWSVYSPRHPPSLGESGLILSLDTSSHSGILKSPVNHDRS